MTVPSPSAPSHAVFHLSCPLPSESCHLPVCPDSLESDASGPGPGRGPIPISPSDGPRLVGVGRHRKKEDMEARVALQIQGRRETSTRREDLRQLRMNVTSTRQDRVKAPSPRSRHAVSRWGVSGGGTRELAPVEKSG